MDEGRWDITLTGVTADGEEPKPPFAMMAANFMDNEIASSALMRPYRTDNGSEIGHFLETGPVAGWRVASLRTAGRRTYALRLLRKPDAPPGQITVHYRYLGLPMQLKLSLD